MKFHWLLYSDIIFFFDHYSAGGHPISIAYCLFPLVLFHFATCLYYAMTFKGCKMIFVVKNRAIILIFAQNTDRGYTFKPY